METYHPSHEQLIAFAAGQITGNAWDSIELHVSDCERCANVIAGLTPTGDESVPLLKRSPAGSSSEQISNEPTLPSANSGASTKPFTSGPILDSTVPWSGKVNVGSDIRTDTRRLGDYELLEEVARGGMGIVYKARQVNLNRIVALKMILAGQFASQEDVQRFYTEAEAAANLDHPGVVPIFEVDEHEGQHFFSMGFVEGESLADKIKDGPLTPQQAAEYAKAVAEAMAYAHERGVIHRDLKPANVLVDQNGQARVTDFGLAKKIEDDSGMTATGQILGTPSYMPPEQAAGRVDDMRESADIYSLGAILYALASGRPPFQSASHMDTLRQVLEQPPVPLRKLNARIPKDIDTICAKCLEKEPRLRYPSASDLADDLRRFLNGDLIHARPVTRLRRVGSWTRKRRRLVSGVAVVALLILTAIGALVRQNRLDRRQGLLDRTTDAVTGLENVNGQGVPFTLKDMEDLPLDMVKSELRRRFTGSDGMRKQALAYGLAHFDGEQVEIEFLLSRVSEAPSSELDNFASAFANAKTNSLQAIEEAVKESEDQQDWPQKARLAILATQMGESSLASDMCQVEDRPDPFQRTVFIDTLAHWHGGLEQLAWQVRATEDASLRSAVGLGVGSVPLREVSVAALEAWADVFTTWHVRHLDTGTHSAAGWALSRWQLPLPTIPSGEQPTDEQQDRIASLANEIMVLEDRLAVAKRELDARSVVQYGVVHRPRLSDDEAEQFSQMRRTLMRLDDSQWEGRRQWEVNNVGLTMLRIPAGVFVREIKQGVNQTVVLTRSFLLSDREVSIELYQRFVNDPNYPDDEKPKDWIGEHEFSESSPQSPVQRVSWYDAVLFCNWLSRRCGLKPCYERTGKKERAEQDAWKLISTANGYRLPSEAQWEYACRAGTTTPFFCGAEAALVDYGVYIANSISRTAPRASRLCNAWGLFDMHGNVWEWCHDWYGSYDSFGKSENPLGTERGSARVLRGGAWTAPAPICKSSYRFRKAPVSRIADLGFRVAVVPPAGEKPASGSPSESR